MLARSLIGALSDSDKLHPVIGFLVAKGDAGCDEGLAAAMRPIPVELARFQHHGTGL
jgi:hypothetical protein